MATAASSNPVPPTNIVIIGHVDSGKSTTTGAILYSCNALDARTLEKHRTQAAAQGKGSFYLAWATDTSKNERDRGITIEAALKTFNINGRQFNIIDAPGHKDFVKNMITGTTQADVAVLIVPAVQSEFISGIDKGGQTVEHATLAHALGVRKIVVCVNKMDRVNYTEEGFFNTCFQLWPVLWRIVGKPKMSKEMKELEKKVDIDSRRKLADEWSKTVPIFAISGFEGVGISRRTLKKEDGSEYDPMPWNKRKLLLDYFEKDLPVPQADLTRPTFMPVSNISNISGVGMVLSGKILQGVLKKEQSVVVVPSKVKGKVKSIESFHKGVDQAVQGQNVGITLKNKSCEDPIAKGFVIGCAERPPKRCSKFLIRGIVIGDVKKGVAVGYSPILSCHQLKCAVKITEIQFIASKKAPNVNVVDQRQKLQKNDIAEFTVETEKQKEICVEPFTKEGVRAMSQIVLRVSNKTMFVGVVKKVL